MKYRIRFHPSVSDDLAAIVSMIIDYSGPEAATRRLAEIEKAIASLRDTPHKGSIRKEIAPGLRDIPAGRKAVISLTVDDEAREVLIHVIAYAGADWIARSRAWGGYAHGPGT